MATTFMTLGGPGLQEWDNWKQNLKNGAIKHLIVVFHNPGRNMDLELRTLSHCLNTNRSIESLTMCNAHFRRNTGFFLTMNDFWQNNPNIRTFNLTNCFVEDRNEWSLLATALAQCTTLEEIYVEDIDLSDVFVALAPSFTCGLTCLRLRNCNINNDHISILIQRLETERAAPRVLDLSYNTDIGMGGCLLLSRLNLDRLLMDHCSRIMNSGVAGLLHSNRLHVTHLELSNAGIVLHKACELIARYIARNDCPLVVLDLENNNITDKGMDWLAHGLKTNTSLDALLLSGNSLITNVGWGRILHSLCDASSIEAIQRSNHTLTRLTRPKIEFYGTCFGKQLEEMLAINSKAKALEQAVRDMLGIIDVPTNHTASKIASDLKIIQMHLLETMYGNQYASDYYDHIIIYLMGWIGRYYGGRIPVSNDAYGKSAFYNLIQQNPHLIKLHQKMSNSIVTEEKEMTNEMFTESKGTKRKYSDAYNKGILMSITVPGY